MTEQLVPLRLRILRFYVLSLPVLLLLFRYHDIHTWDKRIVPFGFICLILNRLDDSRIFHFKLRNEAKMISDGLFDPPFVFFYKLFVAQLCPTLCNSMNCSPPGSSVPGILQARILEQVAIPSPGNLRDPGMELTSPALQVDSEPSESLHIYSIDSY